MLAKMWPRHAEFKLPELERNFQQMSTENTRYLSRRRKRREKVQKYLKRLKKAGDARERAKVIDKLWKINPSVIPPEFMK